MLSNQKPSSDKLGLGFNSFEASSSGTKEIFFVKAQKKASSDGGPINMGNPHIEQAAPKIIMGLPAATPGSEKSVSFQKSILGPRLKHITVNNVKVPVTSDDEIKDSGCSKHMTGNQKLFSTYKAYNGGNVIFCSNLYGNIIGKGQIYDNKCRVTFFEHDYAITKDGKVIGRGIRKKGLYVMTLRNNLKDKICLATIDENSTLWHRRLVHTNMRLIQSLVSKELVRNLPMLKFDQHFYDAFKIGKQAHASHRAKNIISTTRCLELLHMDLFGPSAVRSYRGNRYTLVIVNYYSRKPTLDYFRVFGSKCFILNTKDYLTKFDPKSYEGVFLGYSQNSKAYIIRNKHTRKIKELLNVTFDEAFPPSKTLPLVDNDLDEEEAIKVTEKKNLENDIKDETLEINEIVNIKESRNHPFENVIGNLNQRILRNDGTHSLNRVSPLLLLLVLILDLHTDRKRIFKKRSKKKAKNKQIQAREGKDQVKSKSKSHPLEEITTSGAKTAKPKVVLQKIKKTRAKTANRVDIAFKLYNFRGPNCILPPKSLLSHPKTQLQLIDSKEAQMKSKAGICFGFTSHNKHTSFLLSKEAQAASPRLRL
ncbi:retrovirus-related pol polyprotein from transposon TNT 1-94 [Tanacetum coccineum]